MSGVEGEALNRTDHIPKRKRSRHSVIISGGNDRPAGPNRLRRTACATTTRWARSEARHARYSKPDAGPLPVVIGVADVTTDNEFAVAFRDMMPAHTLDILHLLLR